MEDLQLDDLIAVRIFKNDIEQKELLYVEQGTVSDAKELLDVKFNQKGSFQRGPLLMKPERVLELGCIYSYYFTDTSQSSQPPSSFQRVRDAGLEELWKQLAEAKETNGFLELRALIKKIPKASAGKLLVLDSYRKLLRIIEQRSGAKLLSDEQSSSNLSQSKQGPVQTDAMPSPSEKQKMESDQSCSGNEIQDTEMADVDEGFHLFEPDDSSPVPELPKGYVDRAMGVTGTPGKAAACTSVSMADAKPELPDALWYVILEKVALLGSDDTNRGLLQLMRTSQFFRQSILELTSREVTLAINKTVNLSKQACSIESYILRRAATVEVVHIQFSQFQQNSLLLRLMCSLSLCGMLKCLDFTTANWKCTGSHFNAAHLLNNLPDGLTSLHCSGFNLDFDARTAWSIRPLSSLKEFDATFSQYNAPGKFDWFGSLEWLSLGGYDSAKYLPGAAELTRLTSLQLPDMQCLDYRLVGFVQQVPFLLALNLPGLSTIGIPSELAPLQDHPCLQTIDVTSQSAIWDSFELAAKMPSMRTLHIGYIDDEGQGLACLNWSQVKLVHLSVEWYVSPQAFRWRSEIAAFDYTLDVVNMMTAPRLQSLSLYCRDMKLCNFSMITRQVFEAKKFKFLLKSVREFADEDAAWFRSLGCSLNTIRHASDDQVFASHWEARL